MSQQADKPHGCLIWTARVSRQGRTRQQGVREGREPVAAAAPDLARQVGDGGNAIVAVRLHHHMRIASLCGQHKNRRESQPTLAQGFLAAFCHHG